MKKNLIKWMILFSIYILVFLLNINFDFGITNSQFYIFTISFAVIAFFGMLYLTNRRLKYEKQEFKDAIWNSNKKILVLLVEKNENKTIIKSVNHYLKFPDNVRTIVYDDSSDDGTFEELKKIESENPDKLIVKTLKKTDKVLHSKGHAIEDMLKDSDADFYLVNDADTLVDFDGLKNMIYYMDKNNIDVVHTSRRNWNTGDSDNILADTEEMMMTLITVLKFSYWNFTGSGYVLTKKAAKKIEFGKYTPGDDTEVGRILRKNKCKIEFLLSVNAYEKAPTSYLGLFKQRSKWYKNTVHQFIEKELFTIIFLTFFASNVFFFFVNPLSIANMIFSIFMILLFSAAFSCNFLIAQRKFLKSFLVSVASALSYWVNISITFTYHLLTFPFKRKKLDFGKTVYR